MLACLDATRPPRRPVDARGVPRAVRDSRHMPLLDLPRIFKARTSFLSARDGTSTPDRGASARDDGRRGGSRRDGLDAGRRAGGGRARARPVGGARAHLGGAGRRRVVQASVRLSGGVPRGARRSGEGDGGGGGRRNGSTSLWSPTRVRPDEPARGRGHRGRLARARRRRRGRRERLGASTRVPEAVRGGPGARAGAPGQSRRAFARRRLLGELPRRDV